MKRIAFYGGSFDPPHNGHLAIAEKLTELFAFDEFVFIPAFHAPHKLDRKPVSAFHRYAMLALATANNERIKVSPIEVDQPEKPFTIETQTKLKEQLPDCEIFFVIGADSWNEIDTWREWGKVLTLTNIIVVTRPDYDLEFSQVTKEIKRQVVDLRNNDELRMTNDELKESKDEGQRTKDESRIYLTDAVQMDISATEIRQMIRDGNARWREFVPQAAADYVEKYGLYLK